MRKKISLLLLVCLVSQTIVWAQDWQMKKARIMTPWSENIDPNNVLNDYPRPQLVRGNWMNLNGIWDFTKVKKMAYNPSQSFDKKILVPFPMESAISGIMNTNHDDNKGKVFLYSRKFSIPTNMQGKDILLHFGAVDWKCEVYINGIRVGEHKGGFDPFYFNITSSLDKNKKEQEVQVFVQDYQEYGGYPHGKQKIDEKTIWYTPVTGIWQTVWLEDVAKVHIEKLIINPDIDKKVVNIKIVSPSATSATKGTIKIYDGKKLVSTTKNVAINSDITIPVANMKLWSPDSPFLYDMKIEMADNKTPLDQVSSYFGMRKISVGKQNGLPCMLLNNKPLFHYGVLDQGYWPDGIYTAPTDEALKYDLIKTKEFGMNMTRKHIKVEPARWYYHCDKLGLLVWQDIPNVGFGEHGKIIGEDMDVRENFHNEMLRIMESLNNYPSIVLWTVYNESWGQPDETTSRKSLDIARNQDKTRLISIASGWHDSEYGDIKDTHWYPEPNMLPNPVNKRASVCGEYGGITLKIDGHRWIGGSDMKYTQVYNSQEFTNRFIEYVTSIEHMKGNGLSAAVYTQLTDVEDEENGMITYDRKVVKVDEKQIKEIKKAVERNYTYNTLAIAPISNINEVVNEWKYYMSDKAFTDSSWKDINFTDTAWKTGRAPFGNDIRDMVINTKWTNSHIYIRKNFDLKDLNLTDISKLKMQVFYDEDCEIYINGVLAASLPEYTNRYKYVDISTAALATIKPGKPNLVAIKCSQTRGGQFIDLGFYLTSMIQN